MEKFTKDSLIYNLTLFDCEANLLLPRHTRLKMVIAGGSALVLLDVISRSTDDIDTLTVRAELSELFEDYGINTRVNAYINYFPYNYEDRLVKLPIDGKSIDFYAVSLEDIVIAKLHSVRDTDIDDINNPDLIAKLDWELLDRLATADDELKASAMNDSQYNEFLYTYNDYKQKWKTR